MSYHPVHLNLHHEHVKKLAMGRNVQLKPEHLVEGHQPVHLTKQQIGRIHKARKAMKGVRLGFSESQRKHNLAHGGGFFDTLKGLAKSAINSDIGKSIINKGKDVGLNLLNKGIDKASNYITNKTGFDTSSIAQMAKDKAGQLADVALQKASEHINGSGMQGAGPLSSIPIIGPILGLFGLGITPAKGHRMAHNAVHKHLKDGKSIRHHLAKEIEKHIKGGMRKPRARKPRVAGVGVRRRRLHGSSFLLP